MPSRRFTLSALISFLLLITTLTLWPLSYYYETYLQLYPDPSTGIGSARGKLWLFHQTSTFQWGHLHDRYNFIFFTYERHDMIPSLGSYHIPLSGKPLYDKLHLGTKLQFPYWFLTFLTAPLPIIWLGQFLNRPPKDGLCQKCGYDLRASIDRCPECGTPIPQRTVPQSRVGP